MTDRTSRAVDWLWSPTAWVVALLAVAGLGTWLLAGDDEPEAQTGTSTSATETPTVETAAVHVDGEPLPPFTSPTDAVGIAAPSLSGVDFDSRPVELVGGETARLYGFFAHWCPHCQAELPSLTEWIADTSVPDQVEVVAVSTAVEPSADNWPPSAWFEREGWTGTVLVDSPDGAAASAFGLTAFPFWVVTDADGDVLVRTTGVLDHAQLDRLVALAADPDLDRPPAP